MRGRWRSSGYGGALVAASLLLALAACELLLRLLRPQERKTPYATVAANEASWGSLHGTPSNFTIKHRGREWDVVYRTNGMGFRDRDHALAKPPGTRRVVVLGDSFAWGLGVASEQIFPVVLEELLNERPGPRWEVINLGIWGTALSTYDYYYRNVGTRFSPDVVLMNFDVSDLDTEFVPHHRLASEHSATAQADADTTRRVVRLRALFRGLPFYAWLCENSHLWALLRRSSSAWLLRSARRAQDAARGEDAARREQAAQRRASATFDRLAADACRSGVALVVLGADRNISGYPLLDRRLRELQARRPRCLRLVPVAMERPGDFFRYDGHWNAAGHARVARAAERPVREAARRR